MRKRIGRLLMILAAVVGLHPLFIAVSLPLYLTGVVFIYRSEMSLRSKQYWIASPIVFVLFVWSFIIIAYDLFDFSF